MNFPSPGIPIPIPRSRENWGMGMKIPQLVNIPHIPHSRGMGMAFLSDFPIPRHSPDLFKFPQGFAGNENSPGIPIPIPRK